MFKTENTRDIFYNNLSSFTANDRDTVKLPCAPSTDIAGSASTKQGRGSVTRSGEATTALSLDDSVLLSQGIPGAHASAPPQSHFATGGPPQGFPGSTWPLGQLRRLPAEDVDNAGTCATGRFLDTAQANWTLTSAGSQGFLSGRDGENTSTDFLTTAEESSAHNFGGIYLCSAPAGTNSGLEAFGGLGDNSGGVSRDAMATAPAYSEFSRPKQPNVSGFVDFSEPEKIAVTFKRPLTQGRAVREVKSGWD
jgi:hypothetical protein